jgi:hypothetical protein
MSYLTIPAGIPNFQKAVLSFWFRVPSETMASANNISLLAFGEPQQETELIPNWVNLCGDGASGADPGPQCPAIESYSSGGIFDLNPCMIGLNCADPENAVLTINLQTKGIATGAAVGWVGDASASSPVPVSQDEINEWSALANTPGSGWILQRGSVLEGGAVIIYTHFVHASGISDLSDVELAAKRELFRVETVHSITPDSWHHFLLSFDLSNPIATRGPPVTDLASGRKFWDNVSEGASSYARMWYAIDNVDYRGRSSDEDGDVHYHMGPYSVDHDTARGEHPGPRGGDPNGILTENGWKTAYNGSPAISFGNQPLPIPTYDLSSTMLPAKDAELGIPAPTKYVDYVGRVEMAELQLFTGVTLDTGEEVNRRAFIDFKRDDGVPVDDVLRPVDPQQAAALLGKKPEVLLHGSDKWIGGKNTGSLGIDLAGNPIPSGQFQPTGGIKTYTPDPSLVA